MFGSCKTDDARCEDILSGGERPRSEQRKQAEPKMAQVLSSTSEIGGSGGDDGRDGCDGGIGRRREEVVVVAGGAKPQSAIARASRIQQHALPQAIGVGGRTITLFQVRRESSG